MTRATFRAAYYRARAWWADAWPAYLLLALFVLGGLAGWLARGGEHIVAGRCRAPSLVSITREGGDLIVRCAR